MKEDTFEGNWEEREINIYEGREKKKERKMSRYIKGREEIQK